MEQDVEELIKTKNVEKLARKLKHLDWEKVKIQKIGLCEKYHGHRKVKINDKPLLTAESYL